MVICVYGSSSESIDERYFKECYELGRQLAKRGHSLIFGAGGVGIMGAVANGFKAENGYVHGVIPKFFEENGYEGVFYKADKLTRTETMAQRKSIMEDGCDAFVVAPGGVGTFEELFEAITLKQLGRHNKAIAVFNVLGYYDNMDKLFEMMAENHFVNKESKKLYKTLNTIEEVIEYVENYKPEGIDWADFKVSKK
ncbi:MAG: TIGR00730 family Rossman fold protein [Clostridia bacterium]|nr:TIGR00730 family Rossman fold protein [Clostridia bacterium]